MKIKGLYKKVLIVVGIATISLSGCRANEDKVEDISISSEEEVADDDIESMDDEDTTVFVEEETPQTALEDIGGEGMQDTTMPDITKMEESLVGEPVIFKNDEGVDICSFEIESVKTSDMKIEYADDVIGKKIVVVNYSYKHMSDEGSLLLDDMSFKLLANDTVCMPYFSPELTPAEPSGDGEAAFGQVAFLVDAGCKDVIVAFDNTTINANNIFKTEIK